MAAIVHVNRRLTDVSLHFPSEFDSIGDYFFPEKPVDFLSDQFASYNKANMLSIRDLTPLGDDDVPPSVQLKWDADTTYNCAVYGVSSPGKWISSKNADPSLDYETERAIQLTLSLRLRLEYLKVKQRLRSSTYMTNYGTATALMGCKFDDYTNVDNAPVKFLKFKCVELANANNGRRPNRITMASEVLNAICETEDFKTRVQYTVIPSGASGKDVVRDANGQLSLLEAMIGVAPGTIKLADHVYNAAAVNQTASYKKFIGSDIVIGYVEPLGLRAFSMSAAFTWSAYPQSPMSIISVPQYNRGTIVTEELRAFTVTDPKIIKPELGLLITGCVDTTAYGGVLD